jgi:hypothetical protein
MSKAGHVFCTVTGEAFVESSAVPGVYYLVRAGGCSCTAGIFRAQGRRVQACRHVRAVSDHGAREGRNER